MLKLYQAGNSICTQKVQITLDEKGLPYDTQNINLFTHEQYSPEYLKINPKGVVPSLDHDGKIVIESTIRRLGKGLIQLQGAREEGGALRQITEFEVGRSDVVVLYGQLGSRKRGGTPGKQREEKHD